MDSAAGEQRPIRIHILQEIGSLTIPRLPPKKLHPETPFASPGVSVFYDVYDALRLVVSAALRYSHVTVSYSHVTVICSEPMVRRKSPSSSTHWPSVPTNARSLAGRLKVTVRVSLGCSITFSKARRRRFPGVSP